MVITLAAWNKEPWNLMDGQLTRMKMNREQEWGRKPRVKSSNNYSNHTETLDLTLNLQLFAVIFPFMLQPQWMPDNLCIISLPISYNQNMTVHCQPGGLESCRNGDLKAPQLFLPPWPDLCFCIAVTTCSLYSSAAGEQQLPTRLISAITGWKEGEAQEYNWYLNLSKAKSSPYWS